VGGHQDDLIPAADSTSQQVLTQKVSRANAVCVKQSGRPTGISSCSTGITPSGRWTREHRRHGTRSSVYINELTRRDEVTEAVSANQLKEQPAASPNGLPRVFAMPSSPHLRSRGC
jgi:hypothetical protein